MTARSIIATRRAHSLDAFEGALASLQVDEEYPTAMAQAGTGTSGGTTTRRPSVHDDFGNHAYNAAAFAALAEALVSQQERISELERKLEKKGGKRSS